MGVKRILYVYNGLGINEACRDQLFKTLTALAHPDCHAVQYITPEQVQQGTWKSNAALIAFGGGYDKGYIRALKQEGLKHIQNYVQSGGSFLGLCAGGYFGCDRIAFDKNGPLEICGERDLKFFPGTCEGPVFPGFEYRSFKGATAASITYRDISGNQIVFSTYYNGGGCFTIHEGVDLGKIEILARFNNHPDNPIAIVKTAVGNDGVAILAGIHPEYDSRIMPRDNEYVKGFVHELDKYNTERINCFVDLLKRLRITSKL